MAGAFVLHRIHVAFPPATPAGGSPCRLRAIGLLVMLLGAGLLPGCAAHAIKARPAADVVDLTNRSQPTRCAEEDNINMALGARRGPYRVAFTLAALHPPYPIGPDNREPDFSNCPPGPPVKVDQLETIPLLDDHVATVVHAIRDPNFYRPAGMTVRVGQRSESRVHCIRLVRRIPGTDWWPEVLVMYSDGNLRLKPQTPADGCDPAFGSSINIGPATPSQRPYAEVKAVEYRPSDDALEVSFGDGSWARIRIVAIDRRVARLQVTGCYRSQEVAPFATFRSMFVTNDNCDVDHVSWSDAAGRRHDQPILSGDFIAGTEFLFGRKVRSQHSTSAPDIWVGGFRVHSLTAADLQRP